MSRALSGSLGGSVACLVASRRGPAATVDLFVTAGLLTAMAALAPAQDIELSNIDNGIGGFVINGQAANDFSGYSVSGGGDVNGDGLGDVIVGAFASDPLAGPLAGRSYVVFGKSAGVDVDLSSVDSGIGGFVINGQSANDWSGWSVCSAGDVNGDGLGDVLVGARQARSAAGVRAGRSYVVFGKPDGAAVDLSAVENGTGGFALNGQAAYDQCGVSVGAAGDVNGDGLADVIVGAFGSDPAAHGQAGRSYVVFGKTSGTNVELSTIDNGTGGFVINGQAANDWSGWSVASAGDVNGDGLADLIVGADLSDPPAGDSAGRSYVVFGKTDTADVELSAVDGTGASGGTGGFVINGQAAVDLSGYSVAGVGDINDDGLADLIVGAALSDPAGVYNAGRSYVVFGKTGGTDVDLSAIDNGTGGFVINGQDRLDQAGSSVCPAGDVDGDGLADFIVGAQGGDPMSRTDAGRSYLVLGKAATNDVDLSTVEAGTGGFGINGQMLGDRSGRSVSAVGDVNGDGLSDLIVGAPNSDPAAGSEAGRSYVVFSPYTPATTATYRGQVAAGNPNRQGIGIHRFGDDATVFPDSRAWVDFDAGTGPGLASSSEVVATITRNDSGLTGFDPLTIANVQWQLTTNRTGWSACRVTVRYTDPEIVGLTEGDLVLYTAPTAAGPFVPAANFTLTPTRNEAAGDVASMPAVFVLLDLSPNGDANNDGDIDVADVTAIYNFLDGIVTPLPGDGDVNNVGGVTTDDAALLIDHLINGTPLP